MSKRLVDIDDELLDEATAILGASTMKEAVNRSLEEVVLAARRRRHADRLSDMHGLDLADPEVMAGAWIVTSKGSRRPGGAEHEWGVPQGSI
jgi:Arc/MetJ family transcription regulator